MAETNLTGGQRRELTKYRMTFAAALAGWMIQAAYEQHIEVLRIGDQTGERLQMRGLIEQEVARHGQR